MKLRRSRLSFLGGIYCCIAAAAIAAPEPPAKDLRSYHDGPLVAADYRAPLPNPLPMVGTNRMQALTWTRIVYKFDYKYTRSNNQFVVTLTRFTPTAYLERQASWNASPDDSRLLDHEQGHFDITHLAALQFRHEIDRLRQTGKPLQAQGPRLSAAGQALQSKLDEIHQRYKRAAAEEHLKYDKMTSHGRIGSAQAHLRSEQRQQIAELERQFQAVDQLLSGD